MCSFYGNILTNKPFFSNSVHHHLSQILTFIQSIRKDIWAVIKQIKSVSTKLIFEFEFLK